MASSLFAGVAGLKIHQTLLDVVGNNLANVNTTGFKGQRVEFQDVIYSTMQQASAPAQGGQLGGTNPIQVGLGAAVASIDTSFQQGSIQLTGRDLDLALQGNGFFVVSNSTQKFFTRAGSFDVDSAGFIVDPSTGYYVQRFGIVGETGANAYQVVGDNRIRIPFGASMAASATANVTLQGNLSANMLVGDTYSAAIQVYDTQGRAHSLTITFTKTAGNTFSATAAVTGGTVAGIPLGPITFNADGSLAGPATGNITLSFPPDLPAAQPVTLQFGTVGGFDGLTQFGNSSAAVANSQDGFAAGTLTSFSVNQDGIIRGLFTNGREIALAQLAVASFANPNGLNRQGNTYFLNSGNSGDPLLGTALAGDRGSIQRGALEQSNIDTAAEFTRLIIAQRGFQLNARTITASDEVLQELANLIR
jgi:flagellar hook protein FlgE